MNAPSGPTLDEVTAGVAGALNQAQDFLAQLTAQANAAGLGQKGTGAAGSTVQNITQGVSGAASNLQAAANLSRAVPLVILVFGVLLGKTMLGLIGAVVAYLYLNPGGSP